MKLVVAIFCGMIIGAERLYAHKTASMRTYALVSMGAALFVILALEGGNVLSPFYSGLDPLHMIGQIISGIGFLGAGLIIFKNSHLSGITSASGLWVCAGIGMASGFGFYDLALVSSFLVLFIFTVLWFIEQKIKHLKIFEESEAEK
jgi:putative Mg2+ transporter-C (MgtC) family protein